MNKKISELLPILQDSLEKNTLYLIEDYDDATTQIQLSCDTLEILITKNQKKTSYFIHFEKETLYKNKEEITDETQKESIQNKIGHYLEKLSEKNIHIQSHENKASHYTASPTNPTSKKEEHSDAEHIHIPIKNLASISGGSATSQILTSALNRTSTVRNATNKCLLPLKIAKKLLTSIAQALTKSPKKTINKEREKWTNFVQSHDTFKKCLPDTQNALINLLTKQSLTESPIEETNAKIQEHLELDQMKQEVNKEVEEHFPDHPPLVQNDIKAALLQNKCLYSNRSATLLDTFKVALRPENFSEEKESKPQAMRNKVADLTYAPLTQSGRETDQKIAVLMYDQAMQSPLMNLIGKKSMMGSAKNVAQTIRKNGSNIQISRQFFVRDPEKLQEQLENYKPEELTYTVSFDSSTGKITSATISNCSDPKLLERLSTPNPNPEWEEMMIENFKKEKQVHFETVELTGDTIKLPVKELESSLSSILEEDDVATQVAKDFPRSNFKFTGP
eukprot:COSAG01_NODE_2_length_63927_cov_1357.611941_48_plen_506_part_00